jgi:hypothetical protein
MSRYGFRIRWIILGAIASTVVVAGVMLWLERTELMVWYSVRGLSRAGEAEREFWAKRVAEFDELAIPRVLKLLAREDPRVCGNAGLALSHLVKLWGIEDSRTADLTSQLARSFAQYAPLGQETVLRAVMSWFALASPGGSPSSSGFPAACGRLLEEAATVKSPQVQRAALELTEILLDQPGHLGSLSACRRTTLTGLHSADDANRLQAIRLALHPGVDLLSEVVPLLDDRAAEVRRAAIVAVGPAEEVVLDEELLPRLHDPDPEVRQLCEVALRARGLQPQHIKLGRLLTDPRATERLKVLDHLRHMPELDLRLWLRRLSHDPSAAVRLAAIRAMGESKILDLSERLAQIARNDPSPTVSSQASFYRAQLRSQARGIRAVGSP